MENKKTSSDKKVGLALQVNRKPGAGMMEQTCEYGFIGELNSDKMIYDTQVKMPIAGKTRQVKQNYRVDFVLSGKMIVELKGMLPPPRLHS